MFFQVLFFIGALSRLSHCQNRSAFCASNATQMCKTNGQSILHDDIRWNDSNVCSVLIRRLFCNMYRDRCNSTEILQVYCSFREKSIFNAFNLFQIYSVPCAQTCRAVLSVCQNSRLDLSGLLGKKDCEEFPTSVCENMIPKIKENIGWPTHWSKRKRTLIQSKSRCTLMLETLAKC